MNPPGDSNATDGRATLELAIRVRAEAMTRLDGEADWLREQRIDVIACDAPAPPLVAAQPGGDSRVRDVQLHLGGHLCALCP